MAKIVICLVDGRKGARMATMNISLPAGMKAWVEAQTEGGRYGNASDYVRDLIRRDQERQDDLARLRQLVDGGIDSGIGTMTAEELIAEARRRAGARGL